MHLGVDCEHLGGSTGTTSAASSGASGASSWARRSPRRSDLRRHESHRHRVSGTATAADHHGNRCFRRQAQLPHCPGRFLVREEGEGEPPPSAARRRKSEHGPRRWRATSAVDFDRTPPRAHQRTLLPLHQRVLGSDGPAVRAGRPVRRDPALRLGRGRDDLTFALRPSTRAIRLRHRRRRPPRRRRHPRQRHPLPTGASISKAAAGKIRSAVRLLRRRQAAAATASSRSAAHVRSDSARHHHRLPADAAVAGNPTHLRRRHLRLHGQGGDPPRTFRSPTTSSTTTKWSAASRRQRLGRVIGYGRAVRLRVQQHLRQPGGCWNWAANKPGNARLGFAYYLDGGFKNYHFNNIAWGT